jgi:hypothetical protein
MSSTQSSLCLDCGAETIVFARLVLVFLTKVYCADRECSRARVPVHRTRVPVHRTRVPFLTMRDPGLGCFRCRRHPRRLHGLHDHPRLAQRHLRRYLSVFVHLCACLCNLMCTCVFASVCVFSCLCVCGGLPLCSLVHYSAMFQPHNYWNRDLPSHVLRQPGDRNGAQGLPG